MYRHFIEMLKKDYTIAVKVMNPEQNKPELKRNFTAELRFLFSSIAQYLQKYFQKMELERDLRRSKQRERHYEGKRFTIDDTITLHEMLAEYFESLADILENAK